MSKKKTVALIGLMLASVIVATAVAIASFSYAAWALQSTDAEISPSRFDLFFGGGFPGGVLSLLAAQVMAVIAAVAAARSVKSVHLRRFAYGLAAISFALAAILVAVDLYLGSWAYRLDTAVQYAQGKGAAALLSIACAMSIAGIAVRSWVVERDMSTARSK